MTIEDEIKYLESKYERTQYEEGQLNVLKKWQADRQRLEDEKSHTEDLLHLQAQDLINKTNECRELEKRMVDNMCDGCENGDRKKLAEANNKITKLEDWKFQIVRSEATIIAKQKKEIERLKREVESKEQEIDDKSNSLTADKAFHEHIQAHFIKEHPNWQVVCKICGKSYDEIVNEALAKPKNEGATRNNSTELKED